MGGLGVALFTILSAYHTSVAYTYRLAEEIPETGEQESVYRNADQSVEYHEHFAGCAAGRDVAVADRRTDDEREEERMVERPLVLLLRSLDVNIVVAQFADRNIDCPDVRRIVGIIGDDEFCGTIQLYNIIKNTDNSSKTLNL